MKNCKYKYSCQTCKRHHNTLQHFENPIAPRVMNAEDNSITENEAILKENLKLAILAQTENCHVF